jgi:hypothetical protein
MDNFEFFSKYLEVISNVKSFSKYNKDTYIRFRINSSWINNIFRERGEVVLNNILRAYLDRNDANCYCIFALKWGVDYDSRVANFFDVYKAKIIMTKSCNIAGIKFEDSKHKGLFIIKYSEFFTQNGFMK